LRQLQGYNTLYYFFNICEGSPTRLFNPEMISLWNL